MSAHSISKKNSWLSVLNYADPSKPVEMMIYDQIGKDYWTGDGLASSEFASALADIPTDKDILVRIHSPGGSVPDGVNIYNLLEMRRAHVTTRVEGAAHSIASVIAMAGKENEIIENAQMLSHRAYVLVEGNEEELTERAGDLRFYDNLIANVYAKKTKKTPEEMLAVMKGEKGKGTLFNGKTAFEMGFFSSMRPAADFQNSFKVSDTLTNILAAATPGHTSNTEPRSDGQGQQPASVATAPISSNPAGQTNQTTKEPTMEPNNTAPAGTTPAQAPAPVAPAPTVTDTPPVAPTQTANSQPDPVVLNIAQNAAANPPITQTATSGISNMRQGLQDWLADNIKGGHKARADHMVAHWDEMKKHYPVSPLDPSIRNANTDTASGALTVALLSDRVVTVAQAKLAPLGAFLVNYKSGRIGRNVIEIPKVTAGGTAQSNPTAFQDTTNFVGSVDDIAVTPAHIVAGQYLTNAEMQNGWKLDWFAVIKASEFANKIQALINAQITVANFGSAVSTGAAAVFKEAGELKTVWAALKNAPVKNIILDGEYYAQFLPNSLTDINVLTGYPGWDGFFMNNYWTGAATNTCGFACDPSALSGALGIPFPTPDPFMGMNPETVLTLPNNGMQISSRLSWDSSARNIFWTLEGMGAFQPGDTSLGKIIASA